MTSENQDSAEELLAQAEEMIWSLLDDNLPEADIPRLEKMISDDDDVRKLYLNCVQLHCDLQGHFAQVPKLDVPGLPDSKDSPVLGSLGDGLPSIDDRPPVAD